MPADPAPRASQSEAAHLTLRSRLADLALVYPWLQSLALRFDLPEQTVFAIDLCLEEAVSNVIRHGYKNHPGHTVEIRFSLTGDRRLAFIVEDTAPHFHPFDPAAPPPTPAPASIDEFIPGGLGISLMRRFADAVEWEPLEPGNRLTLRFSW